MPDFAMSPTKRDPTRFERWIRPGRPSGIRFAENPTNTRTIDIPGVPNRGYGGAEHHQETALAPKLKHSKGVRCIYTFGRRALFSSGSTRLPLGVEALIDHDISGLLEDKSAAPIPRFQFERLFHAIVFQRVETHREQPAGNGINVLL